ncbi:hypothetical protein V9K67_27060, partial [Paraflavisolibacter sp. H34]|uniref:hypothetical protein n=1 Tax=Huijunlia imazamoxiresistens TaxID=3127457 RepID=UPI003068A834
TGQSYQFDYTAPSLLTFNRYKPTVESAHGASVTYRLTFSERISGLDPTDFTLVIDSGLATGTLASNAVLAQGTAGTIYDVTVSNITKFVRLHLDLKAAGTGIIDAAGNALPGPATGPRYTIDPAPVVDSIVRQSPTTEITAAGDITFRVYFSEKVSGVDATDFFTTTVSGDARGTLAVLGNDVLASRPLAVTAAVGSTGMVYNVTVRAATGTGALRLDVKPSGTGIKDADGQALFGGFTGGQTYTLQQSTSGRFATVQDLVPVDIMKNTADKPQAKVWYHAGKWWSVLAA